MRTILITLMLVLGLSVKAQVTLDYENPTLKVDNKVYTLISSQDDKHVFKYEVYSSNGKVSQTGFFKDGKPDGVWHLYDEKGDLLSTMIFKNGNRIKLETIINGEEVTVVYTNNKPTKRVSIAYLD
jgi:antitoxin component YwqK of YwqJK toxin-antitoxin module